MDKDTFVREAPSYYALAIAVSMAAHETRDVFTLSQLKRLPLREGWSFDLKQSLLVAEGMNILVFAGVAETVHETFGPTLYRRLPGLTEEWLFSGARPLFGVFSRYAEVRNLQWLSDAIDDVNRTYLSLEISPLDFDDIPSDWGPSPEASLWEPLPLDRSDPLFSEVAAKVDEAIESIEADNGYAVTVPGERDYVVQSLKSFRTTLKESAQITGMQIKTFALDPLAIVAKRFGGAALGLVVVAAKDTLVTWLKAKFGALLAALLSGS
jgi:hypothetical protein